MIAARCQIALCGIGVCPIACSICKTHGTSSFVQYGVIMLRFCNRFKKNLRKYNISVTNGKKKRNFIVT